MKLTKEDIEACIVDGKFMLVPDSTTTICALYTQNGGVVIGESACIDPAEFDVDTGQRVAYEKAFEKLWELEGYHALHLIKQSKIEPKSNDSGIIIT